MSRLAALAASIAPLHAELVRHPVYRSLDSVAQLRTFVGTHVFAVWDFMSLLKTLQRRLTCVDVPWLPAPSGEAARLINEIVLGEETDEVAPDQYASHFEVYLSAMRELAADTRPIERFCAGVRAGDSIDVSLARSEAPRGAAAFVASTMQLVLGETAAVAASFVVGREALVPEMFEQALVALDASGLAAPKFRWYLDRHVALDRDDHGPKAQRLLAAICGDDADRWEAARVAAVASLEARRRLWDSVIS